MKTLLLVSLLALTACGKHDGDLDKYFKKNKGIPFIQLDDQGEDNDDQGEDEGGSNAGGSSTGGSVSGSATGGTAAGGTTSGEIGTESGSASSGGAESTSGGSDAGGAETSSGSAEGGAESTSGSAAGGSETSSGSASGGSESTGGTSGGGETPVKTSMTCDFSNVNDLQTFVLDIRGNGNEQNAILSNVEPGGKLTFDHYNLNPSLNENAAVTHEDKNLTIDGLKVIKIMARIVMNGSEGELQVSYKLGQGKSSVETEFTKLADINNCR